MDNAKVIYNDQEKELEEMESIKIALDKADRKAERKRKEIEKQNKKLESAI